jgi:hypothetical protein
MYNVCQSAVKIDNKHSNYFNLEKGVKQGECLRPKLFANQSNIFVTDTKHSAVLYEILKILQGRQQSLN